jgi:hypothetical protein
MKRTALAAWHAWPVFVVRFYLLETWRGLPGPWPVKLLLIAVCLAIPGPQDEILLLLVTQALRVRRARRVAQIEHIDNLSHHVV